MIKTSVDTKENHGKSIKAIVLSHIVSFEQYFNIFVWLSRIRSDNVILENRKTQIKIAIMKILSISIIKRLIYW